MERSVLLYYYVVIFAYLYVTYHGISGRKDALEDPNPLVRFRIKNWYLFFTVWNAVSKKSRTKLNKFVSATLQGLQSVYALLRILEIQCKGLFSAKLYRALVASRSYFYVQFIFPSAIQVFSLFWINYHIDRELVLPAAMDKHVTSLDNHIVHTLIILPVIVDLIHSSTPILLPNRRFCAAIILLYGTLFQIM